MGRHTIILVTDRRQKYLSELLSSRQQACDWREALEDRFCKDIITTAERVILPTPVAKTDKYPALVSTLQKYLNPDQIVFGGMFPTAWQAYLMQRGIPFVDLMKEEAVVSANARITAEAVVAEVLIRSLYRIEGQKIVITGYGRCAKAAAEKLAALGANILILARSRAARKQAQKDGHWAMDFAYGPQEVYSASTVINTVPACVVTEPILREMHKDALLLDIASAPGGCDLAAAEKYGIRVVPALSLPAIYTPKSSAGILADAIREKTLSMTGRKEEKAWIYQILTSDLE